ncbi:hypothetical protein F4604DRAFT_1683400 [Suillus subluteus]|nr:hypothetical protein F4604DRAFT_1683400 [Suillus subluteus]
MSHLFTRNLTFQSNDLGKEATVMLTFDADMEGLYEDFFPVVWKVSKFGKTGPYRAHATYTSQSWMGISSTLKPSVKINDSEKTTLTEANDVYHFSPPHAGVSGVLQAVNSTGAIQDIAVGFMSPGDLMPKPALYFNGVGALTVQNAEMAVMSLLGSLRSCGPTLLRTIKRPAIIRGAIDTPAIWSQDLAGLADSTTWTLKRDAATGHYTMVQS